MRLEETILVFRTMDPALRRYATHMTGANAGSVLHNTYVTAAGDGTMNLHGDQRLVHLFRMVHANGAAFVVGPSTREIDPVSVDSAIELPPTQLGIEPVNLEETANRLGRLLSELPVGERAALLLILLESRSVDQAAEVLGAAPSSVTEWFAAATRAIGEGVPELDSADPVALHRALGALPVAQAHPDFWLEVERALSVTGDLPDDSTASMPIQRLSEPKPTAWPKLVGAGLIVIVLIGAIGLLALTNNDDPDGVAAGSPTTIEPAPTSPDGNDSIAPDETSSTTALETTTSTEPATTEAPTSSTDAVTTTQVDETSQPPSTDGGVIPRGAIPFGEGVTTATLTGGLPPDHTDNWDTMTAGPAYLAVGLRTVEGASTLDVFVSGPDGRLVDLVFSGDLLLVYELPMAGAHVLGISPPNGSTDAARYEISVAVSVYPSAALWIENEGQSAAEGLVISACQVSADGLTATLVGEDDDSLVVEVAYRGENGARSIRWTGPTTGGAVIDTATAVDEGLILSGTIETGPAELIDRHIVVGVYGCSNEG